MRVLFTFFLLTSLVGCSTTSSDSSTGTTPNTPAPNFTLTSVDGTEFSLSEAQGKVVYLFFYGAGCPHCRTNGPVTETRINQEFRSNPNFLALGIDTWNQSTSDNISFRSTTGITYPLLLNGRQTLVDYYGSASAFDRSVVISADGLIVYKGNGFVNTDANTVVEIIQTELNQIGN